MLDNKRALIYNGLWDNCTLYIKYYILKHQKKKNEMGKKCVCQNQIYNYQRKIYNIFEHKIRDERSIFNYWIIYK